MSLSFKAARPILRLGCSSQNYATLRPITRHLSLPSEVSLVDKEGDEEQVRIDRICNKSRLRTDHRNVLFDKKPYAEPMTKIHTTIKYNRKLFGKYGNASGITLGIMWPTKSEISERKEYEKVAFPFTINEMVNMASSEIQAREKENQETQKKVIENMTKLEMWKKQLKATAAKKEAEALAAKEKKEKLIEEVRRHFGFTVDPREERFKEMMALKEKELKKKEKLAKVAEKEKKAVEILMEKHKSDIDTKV